MSVSVTTLFLCHFTSASGFTDFVFGTTSGVGGVGWVGEVSAVGGVGSFGSSPDSLGRPTFELMANQ